jgi:hypothetical protein
VRSLVSRARTQILSQSKVLRVRSVPTSAIIHVELRDAANVDSTDADALLAVEKRLQAIVGACQREGVLLTRSK